MTNDTNTIIPSGYRELLILHRFTLVALARCLAVTYRVAEEEDIEHRSVLLAQLRKTVETVCEADRILGDNLGMNTLKATGTGSLSADADAFCKQVGEVAAHVGPQVAAFQCVGNPNN